ncbi:MAG: hypothetical protein NVS4B6_19160 [Mycobacterium sp.]
MGDVQLSSDGTVLLPLYKERVIATYTVLDAADVEWACQWLWHPMQGYAGRSTKASGQFVTFLHRELVNAPPFVAGGLQVDHINHDRLDNRRANLRIVDGAGNAQNTSARVGTSSYRGVSFDRVKRLWRAQAKQGGIGHVLGLFETEVEAAAAAASWRLAHMPGATD